MGACMIDQEFDIFLCHNSQDKPAVIKIANQLKARNIKPWLDLWNLRPGYDWIDVLDQQIAQTKAIAIFVGDRGIGPWQKQEINAFLVEFQQKYPVIPVLLETAPRNPDLPKLIETKM